MGFFSTNWSKPGLGVDKDAPKKKGIFLYFEIFLRKFWKIIHVNVVYFTLSVLFLLLMYWFAPVPDELLNRMALATNPEGANLEMIKANLRVVLGGMFSITIFCFWGCAPMAAGYAYVTRCFTREQHSWIWSDFIEKVKENFKQSVVVLIIDIVLFFLSIISIYFYYVTYLSTSQGMWLILCSIICMMLVIYTMMHFYIYQIMVTFKCTLKQLYKNSLLLAIAKLPMNVLLTALILVLNYALFILLNPAIAIVISFLIWTSVARFPVEFYVTRVIQKLFINGMESKVDSREAER